MGGGKVAEKVRAEIIDAHGERSKERKEKKNLHETAKSVMVEAEKHILKDNLFSNLLTLFRFIIHRKLMMLLFFIINRYQIVNREQRS